MPFSLSRNNLAFYSFTAVRRRRPGELEDHPGRRQPAVQVHVDQTNKSSIARVHRHLPAADVPKLLEGRFQIINLWRPIANPALDWPLGLCDFFFLNPVYCPSRRSLTFDFTFWYATPLAPSAIFTPASPSSSAPAQSSPRVIARGVCAIIGV